MLIDLGMKSTSNCGYMHYTIAISLEMSDEPIISALLVWALTNSNEKSNNNIQSLFLCADSLTF